MDSGKLNTRVEVYRLTKTADNYGGFTSTQSLVYEIWAFKKDLSGEIRQENGKRSRYNEIELIIRKKTADNILIGDLLKIENISGKYRLNEKFDNVDRFFTKIKATYREE